MTTQTAPAENYDIIVIGSGSGGMMAALTAKKSGASVCILEKAPHYGGSSAMSGGGFWIPNNHVMKDAGIPDSTEMAREYLAHTAGNDAPEANREAFIRFAPEVAKYLEDHTRIKLQMAHGYPDYHPDLPGGTEGGRSLEPHIFPGRLLKDKLGEMHPPMMPIPGGMAFTIYDFKMIGMMKTSAASKWHLVKVGLRNVRDMILRRKPLGMGQALMGGLRHALMENNVPVLLNSEVTGFITSNGTVTGVKYRSGSDEKSIHAKKGVIMASGGFERNAAMRRQYQAQPVSEKWTVGSEGNTGELIAKAAEMKIDLKLMDEAWWGPASIMPGGKPMFHVGERSYPGGIIVDQSGRRYTNESASYVTVVHEMYDRHNKQGVKAIPSYLVFDHTFRSNYMLGTLMPGNTPQEMIDKGYIKKADSPEALAKQINVDATALRETIEQFNGFARKGKDEDFGRGDNAYDRYYGDPGVHPNPCLGELKKPPYYAVELVPGDLGTKGGVVTNEHAQAMDTSGQPVAGLYATGNCSATVMGRSYPGPGATIGAAMTFGYIAAKHATRDDAREY